MDDFHEVRFPLDVALGSRGGPTRRTEIVTLASGREHRNARWAHSRRRFEAGLGVRTLDALDAVIAFFEERRGRLIGFRLHDRTDWKSGKPSAGPAPGDQALGVGDGARVAFQLVKTYGGAHDPYVRTIAKPVAGSVRVAVAGTALVEGAGFSVDTTTGLVTLAAPPAPGAAVTAGFAFDVPVRFDTDTLEIDLRAFAAGAVPEIPLLEIVP
ncbi:phage distal tail protein, Rcc01695 family [Salinarimonas sp. NSM]|uniref:phage distal tail protein, Rcc01695 family n=1 Tax=Salinarimonas sp. NSM TaxID=3458003 RepID=UPI0040373BFF